MRTLARTALALALAAVPSGVARAAPPLDDAERAGAARLAESVPWGPPAPRARTRAAHPLGVQTVLVEVDERKGGTGGERRARVYQYDHDGARARRLIVALVPGAAAGEVLERRAVDGVHWPLGAAERAWVRERLAASGWVDRALGAERATRGLAPLAPGAAIGALEAKASVYAPPDPDDPCARARCALVSLFDAGGTVSTVEPVVRFADGAVVPRGGRR